MIKEFLLKEYIMSPLNYSDFNSKIIENLGIKEKEIKTLSPESKWDVIFKTKREEKIKEFFNENPNQKNKNAVKSFVNFFMNNINLYRDLYIYNLEIIINNCFLTLKDMSQIIQNINMSYYEKIISEEKRKILLNEMTFIISKKEDAILKEKIRSSSDFVASKKRF